MKKILTSLIEKFLWHSGLGNLHDTAVLHFIDMEKNSSTNPLTKEFNSYFSQSDEDGIIQRIFERLGINGGTCVELGVGTGVENNTLNLVLNGWNAFWYGGEDLALPPKFFLPKSLRFVKIWINKKTLNEKIIPELTGLGEFELLSLDLDGNDYHFAKILLEANIRPKLWVQEYNGNFSPITNWIQPYDDSHIWKQDAYFGASLYPFNELFKDHGYTLVACNILGINAFFVRNDLLAQFVDIPKDLHELYRPSRLFFLKTKQKRNLEILKFLH
jgi:hypothetical protein